jgi:hypothetical protein
MFARTIQNGKIIFDLTKSGQEARVQSDVPFTQPLLQGPIFNTRQRRAILQSESILVPVDNIEPFLAVGLIMEHSEYKEAFSVYLWGSRDNITWNDREMVEEMDLNENETDKYQGELVFMDREIKYVQFMIIREK